MISLEDKQVKTNLDPIDSFYGSWVIQLIDNKYYVYETAHSVDMSLEDKLHGKREVFNKAWKKIYNEIIESHPDYKLYLDELLQGFEKLVSGEINIFRHKSPWMTKDKVIYWVHDQLKVVERDGTGRPSLIIGSSFDVTKSKLYMETIDELSEENKNLNIANERAVGFSKMLVWRMEFSNQEIPTYVFANELYREVLGLDFVKKNTILYSDLLQTAYPDEEGQTSMNALLENFGKANADPSFNFFN